MGVSDIVISGNIIRNCGTIEKGYGGINIATNNKYEIMSNIVISDNVIEGITHNETLGNIYLRYVKNVLIKNNIVKSNGRCLCLGVDSMFVRDITVCGNFFEGSSFCNALTYTNEIRMFDNDVRNAVQSQDISDTQAMCKNWNNEGMVARMPQRGTWEIGEVYPTIDGLKRCVTAGTYGNTTFLYLYASTVKVDVTEGSSIAHTNAFGAVMLRVGQYITVKDIIEKTKITAIQIQYDSNNRISGADITISTVSPETASDITVVYSEPSFVTIR